MCNDCTALTIGHSQWHKRKCASFTLPGMKSEEEKQEQEARASKHCLACGNAKAIGLVVCWTCFKHGDNPYKHFDGSLTEYIALAQSKGE